jgi:hypothetical protein
VKNLRKLPIQTKAPPELLEVIRAAPMLKNE